MEGIDKTGRPGLTGKIVFPCLRSKVREFIEERNRNACMADNAQRVLLVEVLGHDSKTVEIIDVRN